MVEAMHPLGACLKQGVELGAILDDFPGAFESSGDHEPLAGAEFPALSRRILEHHAAAGQAAELGLRVTDAPFAARAGPDAAVELLRRIGEEVGDRLSGRVRD